MMTENSNEQHDELYPLDQVEFTPEIARFKDVMRQVVYQTTGIYFDRVVQPDDEDRVTCQLWFADEPPGTGETMMWYAIDGVSLRNVDYDRLVADARDTCQRLQRESWETWKKPPITDEEWRERMNRNRRADDGAQPRD